MLTQSHSQRAFSRTTLDLGSLLSFDLDLSNKQHYLSLAPPSLSPPLLITLLPYPLSLFPSTLFFFAFELVTVSRSDPLLLDMGCHHVSTCMFMYPPHRPWPLGS